MPLLHRKPFVREKPPKDLRPQEHVFLCRVTNEVFRDYDDFFERTILCNSLVWSCAVTGKPGLTYQEALESEKKARQNLQNFPEPLIVPVLYLVTLTQHSRLHEVCDDIFAYVKDRYFVGEIVEVLRNNGERLQCKILEVKAPLHHNGMTNGHVNNADGVTIVISDSDDSDSDANSAQNGKEKAIIDPSLFRYKVKPIKKQLYESVTVKAFQICRRKHLFSRDRLKLFLKQHCESHDGIVKIKALSIAKYKIREKNFSYFFPDVPPTFVSSTSNKRRRRPSKIVSDDLEDGVAGEQLTPRNVSSAAKERARFQKEKEEMKAMEKLKKEKASAVESKKKDKEKRKKELKKIVEEERLKKKEERERLRIEKEKEREKLREEKRKYLEHLKQWSKRREDMECDDLKELPVPIPVKTRLPPEIFGDAVMVLEFLHAFGELFDLQDEFPDGVILEVLEEALVGNDSEGPLCELLFFFLTAIFQAMAEEEEEVAKDQIADAGTKDLTEALDEDADPTKSALSAVATLAAAWPQLHQGCNLKNLDLDSCTLSEILRLHILASGADVTSANAKYRYQKRGGFDATDDACMELRLSNPGLLKKLSSTSVYDLSSGEKMKILHALCGKLLTLVSTRDFIEDSVEVLRQAKQEFRELKAEQHRKEREAAAERIRKKKEERLKGQEQKMKEKQERLKEEQKNPSIEVSIGEEEREELDTSTESKEVETKEQDLEAITDYEDYIVLNKKKRGRRGQNGFKDHASQVETTSEKCEPLTPEEEEALKQEQLTKERELTEKIQKATACTNISPLGRDRLYRRYWLFPSVPGLFVEEDYSGLTEDLLLPRPSSFRDNVQDHIAEKSQIATKTAESLKTESTSNGHQDLNGSIRVQVSQPIHKPNRWWFYSSQEQLDQLLVSLNSRGYRESALKEVLLQEKTRIYEQLKNFPVEKFHILEKPQNEAKIHAGRGRMQNTCEAILTSAEKQLELRLRDFLLDIEDRIFQGTLGSVKVTDRHTWRTALENGQYELLNGEIKENGIIKSETEDAEEMEIDDQEKVLIKDRLIGLKPEPRSTVSTNTSTPQPVNNAVNYLALALLKIQQGIERKFLKAPLGDAEENKRDQKGDKRKKREEDQSGQKDDASDSGRSHKTVLDRWKESLLASASLSQVFLHLSTLERSIIWSKSILNARCKMCRKKGDAESMVLCDGCDRGYHIYCIRPKLKAVPDGNWLCPECRPKQRSRRLSSRQRPSLESDEEAEEQTEDDINEASYEGISEEDDDEEEDDGDDSDSQDEDDQSLPRSEKPQVKLALRTRTAKLTTTISRQCSQPQSTGRYSSRSQQNTPKSTGSYKATGKVIRKTKSAPPSVTKSSRPNSRTTRHNRSLLQADAFIELTSPRRQRRGRKTADNTPANSPLNSLGFRIVDTVVSSEKKSAQVPIVKNHLLDSEPKRRGRKRQLTEPSQMPLNRRSSGRQGGVHELSAFEQLVVELVRHDDSWPFMKLVSKIQVPDYYDIIKRPIALNIIREKVNKCEYKLASEFIEDVELMFSNCFEYNPRNTSEAKAGTRLQAFFHIQAQKLGFPVASGYTDHASPATKKSRI
ncbi:bromodomain adjacent to zinc finger domain protein 1A [Sceloporus undulatus]|uniref:bromodomain adjacent to zinc finger domain protein 1A n=1 Tax=Sceloporus undulatus TaxID=8520 RepID=UPI001C4CCD44|nr:bromodomain adjacent to zinc finger domain protein 1A [Sceloporus undulatus]XP_042311900.1 bromodomain adjacent to zinc finger domain protein 1A [Sceloporus undulatus]